MLGGAEGEGERRGVIGLELHNHSKRNQATEPMTQSCLQWPSVTKNTLWARDSEKAREKQTHHEEIFIY